MEVHITQLSIEQFDMSDPCMALHITTHTIQEYGDAIDSFTVYLMKLSITLEPLSIYLCIKC